MARSEPTLAKIQEKLAQDELLTLDDGVWLLERCDVHDLGALADMVRRRAHGRRAYYNLNRHINYTNYCVLRCKFCSFYRPYPKNGPAATNPSPPSDSGSSRTGYVLSADEVVARAKQAYTLGATEVHIVGGLHPKLPFSYYTNVCRGIRDACPHLHIKAFTAIEIIHFTRISQPRLSIEEVLVCLREAGLGSLPGGGAEIFDDRVHDEAFQTKVGEAGWFEVHRIAHELGMFTNATMLYGHIETPAQRVGHLIKLREHQAESLRGRQAHFNCLVPLSFIPEGSGFADLPGPGGLDDLRTLAVSRLMCPNIPHIKAFWVMHTPKLAQVALHWGVDDLDGTVGQYDITHREANGSGQQALTVDQLRRLIIEAGFEATERDTLYRRVLREGGCWRVEGEPWSVPCHGGA